MADKFHLLTMEKEDLEKIRFIIMISLALPEDCLEIETITGTSFGEYCDILKKIEESIARPIDNKYLIEMSFLWWISLKDCFATNVNGLGIWRKYNAICPFTEDSLRETLSIVKKAINDFGNI